jgi:2'-5' RNA ligase
MLRCFIAVHIPGDIRQAIGRSLAGLYKGVGRSTVRWVAPENIHLTLKFLGDVSPSALDLLQEMLTAEAARHSPFQMRVETLGVFPNLKRLRVSWVGLEAPESLAVLQRGVEAAMARLGYPPEDRAFSPHLTLGRVQDHVVPEELAHLRASLEAVQFGGLGPVRVDNVHLMKSELRPGGSVYSTIATAPLSES